MPILAVVALILMAPVAALVAFLAVAWMFPSLLRTLWWVLLHTRYRFRVHHQESIPKTGPALLVCNHTCYIDWMIFWVSSPRPVRYVMWAGYQKNPVLRFFLSWVRHRLVLLDNRSTRPHAIADSLKAVAAALDAGEVVLVYPEGRLSRNGQMLPFGRGIELVLRMAKGDVPVIPAATTGTWGSFFSHKDGPILRKWPRWGRPKVSVWFGPPLLNKPTATAVRAAVTEARADLAIHDSRALPTVFHQFVRTATRRRNVFRPGFVDSATGVERRLTFGQALVATWCLSSWLRRKLPPGNQPVGVWLPTGLGSALVNLALGYLGRPTVNLNYTAGRDSVESAVRQAELKVVITAKRFIDKVPVDLPAGVESILLEDALAAIGKPAKLLRFLAILTLPSWIVARLIGLPRTATDAAQTIIFSSGSTGEPKGVVLSQRNIAGNVQGFIDGAPITDADVMLATLPFFHSFGYTVCLWAAVCIGARSVYYPDPRAAKEVGELCRKHAGTLMMATATFLRFYLRRCDVEDFRTMKLLICGAEKLPVKLAQEFQAKFGVLPLEGYGCTEVSPVVSTNVPDVHVSGVQQTGNTLGTVGQPLPGVAAKAFHPDTLIALPVGEEGNIGIKGPNVMLGYWKQPDRTAQVIHNGWYLTGDVGRVEPTGFIRITGRISRFAKIAGEMVPLERLEHEMQELFGTGERLVAVSAVADEKRGERLVVLYLPEAASRLDAVLDGLARQGLPNLWVPDRRHCYEIAAFPALGSGKLDLKAVGELAKSFA
ncbi:AMP-binding protein [Limnoglobus roseus]|uniref:Acyl-[ACP]--phospholipid O-acyltransferase n=1 Tax=Limnoglobus roseus TaxID=2598579 RepID=A0A5C1AKF1_9BACT|nr:AMP-binding protein [Limnoglobus roseus]QEL18192.1 acyl-[ACP]--phospholipid O-acyltransferase [Limnoglobus roseus]